MSVTRCTRRVNDDSPNIHMIAAAVFGHYCGEQLKGRPMPGVSRKREEKDREVPENVAQRVRRSVVVQ